MQLHYETRGSGEPLLVLHGYTGCSQDWAVLPPDWAPGRRLVIPDLPGHGKSPMPSGPFRHDYAATAVIKLLDELSIQKFQGLGVSGGANVLLHLATRQPERVTAMVLVSATSYFPAPAREMMRQYPDTITTTARDILRHRHPFGDSQIDALLAGAQSFADTYDDMNFTPPALSQIQARTLIVQGDRDPFYPVEISVEMAKAIPNSSLWIIPNGGHAPIGGERWPEFLKEAANHLLKT